MRKIRLFAIVIVVLARPVLLHGAEPADRAALLTALDQRAATGAPRHLDHDEGEELQAALTAALTRGTTDAELASAATRASIALSTEINPPITDGNAPAANIDVYQRLALPWRMKVAGVIEASLDGSGWRKFGELPDGPVGFGMNLDRIFRKDASRPGFHVVRFRALLRYSGQPSTMESNETRNLPSRTYAVTGTTAAGVRAATLLNNAARANASSLDSQLPAVPLDHWLRAQFPQTEPGSPRVIWTSRWCETRADIDAPTTSSVCALAMVSAPPPLQGHGEIWIKVASVDLSGEKPTWTAETPRLEGVDLIAMPRRAAARLADVPAVLQRDADTWPHMAIALDAADITLTPAAPRPDQPVRVRVRIQNKGLSDVYGLTLDVIAFDTPERMLLHRRFVRTIPAGESVNVETTAAFPLGYGGVLVSAMTMSEHTVIGAPPTIEADSAGFTHAGRIIRPDLAPRGYTQAVRASLCRTPACPNVK